jgi:hypothetical protein
MQLDESPFIELFTKDVGVCVHLYFRGGVLGRVSDTLLTILTDVIFRFCNFLRDTR